MASGAKKQAMSILTAPEPNAPLPVEMHEVSAETFHFWEVLEAPPPKLNEIQVAQTLELVGAGMAGALPGQPERVHDKQKPKDKEREAKRAALPPRKSVGGMALKENHLDIIETFRKNPDNKKEVQRHKSKGAKAAVWLARLRSFFKNPFRGPPTEQDILSFPNVPGWVRRGAPSHTSGFSKKGGKSKRASSMVGARHQNVFIPLPSHMAAGTKTELGAIAERPEHLLACFCWGLNPDVLAGLTVISRGDHYELIGVPKEDFACDVIVGCFGLVTDMKAGPSAWLHTKDGKVRMSIDGCQGTLAQADVSAILAGTSL